jgi:hypothetical protein
MVQTAQIEFEYLMTVHADLAPAHAIPERTSSAGNGIDQQ